MPSSPTADPDIDENNLAIALSEIVEAHRIGGGSNPPANDSIADAMGQPNGNEPGDPDAATSYTNASETTGTNLLLKLIAYAAENANPTASSAFVSSAGSITTDLSIRDAANGFTAARDSLGVYTITAPNPKEINEFGGIIINPIETSGIDVVTFHIVAATSAWTIKFFDVVATAVTPSAVAADHKFTFTVLK